MSQEPGLPRPPHSGVRPLHWLLLSLGGVPLVLATFVATGGLYRTVTTRDGRVFVVNRFTGASRQAASAPLPPPAPETSPSVAPEPHEPSLREQQVLDLVHRAQAQSAQFIGDQSTRTFHRKTGGYWQLLWLGADEVPEGDWLQEVCWGLQNTTRPEYFDNAQEALAAGYWPCADCISRRPQAVVAQTATARAWPDKDAPKGYVFRRGESATTIVDHGDWAAVELWTPATGERAYGWLRRAQLHGDSDASIAYLTRWARDSERAHQLAATGLTAAAIARKQRWDLTYAENLLGADTAAD